MGHHRSRRKNSMRQDIIGGTWLSGWGKDKPKERRIERAIRKRITRREIRETQ